MADHTENTFRGAAKALTDVVRPSLDPKDPLAAEQLNLVVEYIRFVQDRLDDLYERERFELRHALQMVDAIREAGVDVGAELSALLDDASRAATEKLQTVGVPTRELRAAAEAAREALTGVIRASAEFDPEPRTSIARIIIDESEDVLRLERSWYLPFGFDPEPQKALPVAEALRL